MSLALFDMTEGRRVDYADPKLKLRFKAAHYNACPMCSTQTFADEDALRVHPTFDMT